MAYLKPEPKDAHDKENVVREAQGLKAKKRAKYHRIEIESADNGHTVTEYAKPDNSANSPYSSAGPKKNVFQHANHAAKHVMGLMGCADGDQDGE